MLNQYINIFCKESQVFLFGSLIKTRKKTNHIKGYDTIAIHQSNELIHSAKNLMNKSDNLTAELLIKTIG